MPYADLEPFRFAVDKASNTIVEELIAPVYIREWHRRSGRRIHGVEKNLGDYAKQSAYDLSDSLGNRFEVKNDHVTARTGFVFIELRCLEHSEADYWLIFCPLAHVVAKSALLEAVQGLPLVSGGDNGRAQGYLLPLERLEEISEVIIL